MKATSLFTIILFCCLCSTTFAKQEVVDAPSEATERQIVQAVETNLGSALEELEAVVNINSGTMNFAGVKEVGLFFINKLTELGFDAHWQEGADFGRAGHVVATSLATKPNATKVLLIGHLDTVFAVGDDFQRFSRVSKTQIAGPGITDMKGGNIIIVHALRALQESGLLRDISIKVVMTGDEESSGKPLSKSKAALIDAAEWADVALGFEDGDSNIQTAVIARRSSSNWNLEVLGKAAHSSQIFQPSIGAGAIFEAARILNEFREQLGGSGNLTFNPGLIVGGTTLEKLPSKNHANAFGKSNVIAQSVFISGGIRALSQAELSNAQEVMRTIAANNLAHTSAELSFEEGYPPLSPSQGNRRLLEMYSQASQSLGYGPVIAVNPRNAGAADISFTAGKVDMALDGLGLMGSGGHTRNETADITSLKKNIQKAAVLLYRLSFE